MNRQEAQDRQDIRDRQKCDKAKQCPNCSQRLSHIGECRCGFPNWKLNRVDDIAWVEDRSGIYVVINWDMYSVSVRLDIMAARTTETEPLQSFVGRADNVRKAVMRWIDSKSGINWPNAKVQISLEHAAYIGAELERCDTERIDYVQD